MSIVRFSQHPVKSFLQELANTNQLFDPANVPSANIIDTGTGFRIDIAAPGLNKEDFEVKVERNMLTISATKKTENEQEGTTWKRREFAFGTFERSFRLPNTLDTENVKATYTNGVLKVELSKKPELQPVVKTIAVA